MLGQFKEGPRLSGKAKMASGVENDLRGVEIDVFG
jgi:hypothetical protein